MKKATPLILAQLLLLLAIVAPQATSQDGCQIDKSLRDLIEDKFGDLTTTPGGGKKNVYVSNISFMDGVSKTLILSEESKLIDQAVKDGMQAAADTNSNIIINHPQHTVPNTAGSVQALINIWFDPNLTSDEQYARAVSELMDPHDVDILMTGMIIDTGQSIQVRPIGVSKPDKTITAKDLQYKDRDALFQDVNGTLTLSAKGHEEIKKAVKEILEAA